MWDGHPLALTGWLEANQIELTVLHRQENDGKLRATAYRFCASREDLEPTGSFAFLNSFRRTPPVARPEGLAMEATESLPDAAPG
jgi:hypothetical protein